MNTHSVKISKEQLSRLPAESFKGKICIVNTEAEAKEAIADLRKSKIIGFDTETKPSFKRGQINIVSLMQLSTHETCYLIRLNKLGMPDELKNLLEDESVLKIGLSTHDDFHNLEKLSHLEPKGFIDLQVFVKDYGISDNSLSKIYAILFGKRISKGQRLSNWEAQELTAAQQAYAALDALACIRIHDRLTQVGFNPEESEYLVEEEDSETGEVVGDTKA